MTSPRKRGLFGLPTTVVIIVGVVLLGLLILSVLVGPVGRGLLGKFGVTLTFPDWITVGQPHPHLAAPELFHIGGWPVTNTMIATWITCIFLIVVSALVTRRMKLIPGRLQMVFEAILGWMYDFCVGIAGEKLARQVFPVVCTIFLFVLFNAYLSLVPGFGSILITVHGTEEELIRAANTDVNTTLAIAVVSVLYTLVMGIGAMGPGFFRQYFNFGPFFRSLGQIFKGKFDLMAIFNGLIEIFVGLLEWLGFWIRVISFTFRLFGNMTAGEILLLIIAFLVPWVVPTIFYGLELLIGFVQALVFAGLTAVFTSLAVTPHEAETE